jgi:hypothetical protein
MHRRIIVGSAGAMLALVAAGSARADLLGTQFAASYRFPTITDNYPFGSPNPPAFTVGAGVESVVDVEGVTFISVDFAATSLTLVLDTILTAPTWNSAPFNGLLFAATGAHGILSASVDASTTMAGLDASRVVLSADEIGINWNGLGYVDGTVVTINFAFAQVPVPEPASLAVLGIGLLGLAAARRRLA